MTQAQRRLAMIIGRLVENRELRERLGITLDALLGRWLDRVDADAQHEQILITQHLTHGANLAAIAKSVTQHPGIGKRTPIGELRKLKRHQRNPV